MTFKCKAVFKYAFALVFLFAHSVSSADEAACVQELSTKNVQPCHDAIGTAKASGSTPIDAKGMEDGAKQMGFNAGATKLLTGEGKKICGDLYAKCSKVCAGTSKAGDCEKYKSYTEELAAGEVQSGIAEQQAMDTQSAVTGGGMGDMMGGLAGAGIGALMGYMMAKKMKEDQEKNQPTEVDPDEARLPTGQLDCSKGNAYMYGECNAWLEANCAGSTTPACKKFENRYCSSDSKLSKASDGFVGEGLGTPFCKNSVAVAFCKVQGRTMCPSCLGLARNQSAACQQDPTLCLAQNSQEQINEAKRTCPTDPAFADPNYSAGGGGSQVVVLPQTATAKVAAAAQGSGASGISTASVSGALNPAVGSAAAAAAHEAAASGGAGVSNDSQYASGGVAGSTTRKPAATKSGLDYRTASADGRPSDVAGPFGPSLFKTSTEVIKSRCVAGKFNNCPEN